ncbi:MAG: AAA family ATPase, partial [Myxococcales bacterium]|nr:AAA family ATPase [Myxococcales bacterium]
MLTCLRVKNFAIIDAVEVEFGGALNVVTGETGAGKSILIDALELLLGGRARPDVVRTGAKEAEVEGLFDIDGDPAAKARLEAAGVEADDEIVVRRVVLASGKSRAYVNGQLVTATQLATLTEGLADISSQHEHHSLVHPAQHLDYLDAFADLGTSVARMRDAHSLLEAADRDLRDLEARIGARGEREDLLRYQLGEIDEVAPVLGEDAELGIERERLRHAEYLARTAGGAEDALYARDDALTTTLARIQSELEQASKVDP